jgi:ribosome-associated translation inhibitor RaiA
MKSEAKALKRLIDTYMQLLNAGLQPNLGRIGSTGRLRSGTWMDKGTIFGCVSYTPHSDSDEESIEAAITVLVEDESAKFTADICWSDGGIIAEIAEHTIMYNALDELALEVDKLCRTASEEMLRQMRALMFTDHPPKIRPYRT